MLDKTLCIAHHTPHRLLLCALSSAMLALALVLLLASLPAGTQPLAHAAPAALTFIVNSPSDVPDAAPGDGLCETAINNGVCTLRAAIQESNARPGPDIIQLQAGVTYLLTRFGADDTALNGDLDITDSVTILGAGPLSTIIDGNGATLGERVFQITGTVVISGVTIQHGHSGNIGGGLINNGRLTLVNSAILSNTVAGTNDWGGGIYNSGYLTLTNSIVSRNVTGSSNAYGGGIFNQGPLLVISSTLSDNTTLGVGGGIYNVGYTATVVASTISGNRAQNGGGIYKTGSPLIVLNSTISGNYSNVDGGGIYALAGTTSLFNVTLANNRANADDVGAGRGGGVYNAGASTLTFNNSIIGLNTTIIPTMPFPTLNYDDCAGVISSQGYSLLYAFDPAYCTVQGSPGSANPLLGPLQDNGGPTWTHALLPGSPAIDAGNPAGCTDNLGAILNIDQRGRKRPAVGGLGRCDIGAFEFAYALYLPLIRR